MIYISNKVSVINAEGLIMGRFASIVAKKLLNGEKIVIVNSEKVVISGKKQSKVQKVKEFLEVGHPRKGPIHFRRPDTILRKAIRGMLPHKRPKGKQAYRNLKVFIGIPEEFKKEELTTLIGVSGKTLTCKYFTLGELAKEIGWNEGR